MMAGALAGLSLLTVGVANAEETAPAPKIVVRQSDPVVTSTGPKDGPKVTVKVTQSEPVVTGTAPNGTTTVVETRPTVFTESKNVTGMTPEQIEEFKKQFIAKHAPSKVTANIVGPGSGTVTVTSKTSVNGGPEKTETTSAVLDADHPSVDIKADSGKPASSTK